MDITVVLNAYRRPQALKEQYESIMNNTIKPKEVLLWQNYYPNMSFDVPKDVIHASSSKNLGVWSRFAFALNAKTKYICIIDDDTIIGKKYFQNVLTCMCEKPGLYGARGLKFRNGSYFNHEVLGFESNNENIERCDIVGHSWTMTRDMLANYWSELPPEKFFFAGEDIHASAQLQKFGINTYVPPQPKNDPEMWGSLKPLKYGQDENATSHFGMGEMNEYLQYVRSRGFKLIND